MIIYVIIYIEVINEFIIRLILLRIDKNNDRFLCRIYYTGMVWKVREVYFIG
jgi:hypothetical protein